MHIDDYRHHTLIQMWLNNPSIFTMADLPVSDRQTTRYRKMWSEDGIYQLLPKRPAVFFIGKS